VIRAVVAAALLAASPEAKSPEPASAAAQASAEAKAGDALRLELVSGKLPEDPARDVVLGKCVICHSEEYVTLQRLTAKQWKGTVEKMRKFGAPLTDDEVKLVAEYLARNWTTDLPDPRPAKAVAPPEGSLPKKR
jgi:cytochrome c553